MAYSSSLRSILGPLASSSSSGLALEDAAQKRAAIADEARKQLELVDDRVDDTMSEIGEEEAAAYQRKLDADSASFLEATPTGVSDADGLLLYSDGTYRPAGIFVHYPPRY